MTTTVQHPRAAAEHTARHNEVNLSLPVMGQIGLPPPDQLAFIAGVGLLALVGLVEWPVAVLLSVGHALASRHHNKLLREFGEALEEV
jgi:hypothetical protein